MPTTFHPGPDEVVRVTASPELPIRLSVGGDQKANVYWGDSVVDATRTETLEAGKSVETTEPVRIVGATTVIKEVLEPVKTPQGVAADRAEPAGKVEGSKPKQTKEAKKAEEDLAEANEHKAVPSAS